jgi:MFS family permease
LSGSDNQRESVQRSFSWRSWYLLAVLLVLYVLSMIDRQIIAMLVAPMKRDLGLTDLQISLLMGPAFALIYALLGLPAGWLVDRSSRKMIVYAGVVVWCLAACGCGLTSIFGILFLMRMGVGIGEATISPASHSMISDGFPKGQLGTAMALFTMGTVLGNGAALMVGGYMLHWLGDGIYALPFVGSLHAWQLVFIVTGAPGLVLGLLIFTVREPARTAFHSTERPSITAFIAFWAQRRGVALSYLGSFVVITIAIYALQTWTPTFAARAFGWSPEKVGSTLGGLTMVMGVIGKLGSGVIIDLLYARGRRDAPFVYYLVCLVLSVPLAVMAYSTRNPMLFCIGFAGAQMLLIPYMAAAITGLMRITPNEYRGLTSASFLMMVTMATALGPPLTAIFTDILFKDPSMIGISLALLTGICGVIAILSLALGRRAFERAMDLSASWD